MTAVLDQPGLEALRKERASRKAAERAARQALKHAAAVEAEAAVLRQRIAADEAEAQRLKDSAALWMERAQENGRTVRHFKEQAQRYEALYHHLISKTQTEQKAGRP